MDRYEYQKRLEGMRIRHRCEISDLQEMYAMSQSPFKIGDFVTDHIGTIKVERVDWEAAHQGRDVRCVYFGPCFTKAGKPFKSGECRAVYQSNIRR